MHKVLESVPMPADSGAAQNPLPPPHSSRRSRRGVTIVVAAVLLIALPWGLSRLVRQTPQTAAAPSGETSAVRAVRVARPTRGQDTTLTLPANVDAYQTALLYSRVSGYLLRWKVDLGDRVTKGQPLAEIDTPELDRELQQAKANLAQGRADVASAQAELQEAQANVKQAEAEVTRAVANRDFACAVLARNEGLYESHGISLQEFDESRRDADMRAAELQSAQAQVRTRESTVNTVKAKIESRKATVSSLEANVARLAELEGFKTIRAPFDGIVTRRRAEVGSLVTAGNATTSGELFAVAQADTLRIRIHVPQTLSRAIRIGQQATVRVPEYPDRTFSASVARTAQALEPASRTLTVELELSNADQALFPGTYAQVILPVQRAAAQYTVPGGVLVSRPDGMKVAVVDGDSKVCLRPVTLGRDFGGRVEILSGLAGEERLIVNPPDDLLEGESVTIAEGM